MLNTQKQDDQVLNCVKPLQIQTKRQDLIDTAYSQQSRPVVTATLTTQNDSFCLSVKTKVCSSSPKKQLNTQITHLSQDLIGTTESNTNSTQMSLLVSPGLISSGNNEKTEVSSKKINFMNQTNNVWKHSNINLAKSENTDLKKSQSFIINQITVDNSYISNRPSKTFKPKILQHNGTAIIDSRPANLSRSVINLSSDCGTYIPRPNGAIGPLAGKLQYNQTPPSCNIFELAGSDLKMDKIQRKQSCDINDVTNISSSLKSFDSPQNAERFQNLFDLTDLTADLNEFNKFYNTRDCASYSKIERPQNPFDKNFEINKSNGGEIKRKSSFTETDDSCNLLNQNNIPGLKTMKENFRRFSLHPVENLQKQNNFYNQNLAESDVQTNAQLCIAFED